MSFRDRFLPDAESVDGRRVGVVSIVLRELDDGPKMCCSDEVLVSRLEGVVGMVRAGILKNRY